MKPLVCIVEDYADNRVLVTALLNSAGMEVTAAEDGEAMTRVLEGGAVPDLFLLDLSLPGEDGPTLMRRLKSDPRWLDRPVVALTAHAMEGDEAKALGQGFDGYITKPIDIGTFAETVKAYMR
ncbi:MAG TPA: response regulator [Candidatus Dormibacteraeota bacterium]|nr:response regulator [Candidatus Dormibacteraeota bacterium]